MEGSKKADQNRGEPWPGARRVASRAEPEHSGHEEGECVPMKPLTAAISLARANFLARTFPTPVPKVQVGPETAAGKVRKITKMPEKTTTKMPEKTQTRTISGPNVNAACRAVKHSEIFEIPGPLGGVPAAQRASFSTNAAVNRFIWISSSLP